MNPQSASSHTCMLAEGDTWLHRVLFRRIWSVWWWATKLSTKIEIRYGLVSRNGERLRRMDLAQSEESITLIVVEEVRARVCGCGSGQGVARRADVHGDAG